MSDAKNSLGSAASAYLRSARHQPVHWQEWGEAAFTTAREENKPVLLDIGAVWCHWCHVMDRESYEDAQTAALINDLYIAVKVDRDERPDVDTRYQAAVAAISEQSGWPLTAFLTPDGKPYFGGTYFPPEERYGRPSFQRVLLTMAEAFRQRRDEVEDSAGSVMQAIEHNENFSGESAALGPELLERLIASPLRQFDTVNGGFGSQPKFPYPGVLDLLLDAAGRSAANAAPARHAATVTLRRMAAGGICDQLAGGFHRYSVDERWVVPHFEKMAYDNSELLKSYVHAFQVTGEPAFAAVARDIVGWMDACLTDRAGGGFYASQDADISLDDDGDYFTWTRAEAAAVLSADEFAAAAAFYNLRAVGDMHHNPQKNVLHRGMTIEQIAQRDNRPTVDVEQRVASAREKLLRARLRRPTPYVDTTLYTGWNAMCISAFLVAARVLRLPEVLTFALQSLDRILSGAWSPQQELAHVIAYNEGRTPSTRVAGVLEDYAFLASAALDAWEATGELLYFTAAQQIAEAMLLRFCDVSANGSSHGFFDTETDPAAIGALVARRKPLQDAPTPAGNAMAATVLLRLHALTGNDLYRTRAAATLESFAGVVEHLGLYAASYAKALRLATEPPLQVCVVGNDRLADDLEVAALRGYRIERSVIRLRTGLEQPLPPALAETLPRLPNASSSRAIVCCGASCLPPFDSVEALAASLA